MSETIKSWSAAFKDPKVLVVLITLAVSAIGGAITMLIQFGNLEAKVEILTKSQQQHESNIANMNNIIVALSEKCGD